MENMWEMPEPGRVKLNVHAVHYDNRLPNGNNSGIGVVVRNSDGQILVMVSGSIRNLNPRANELWSILLGLRSCLYEDEHNIILETEADEAVKEWQDWRWFIDPRHASVVESLNHRKKDRRLNLEIRIVNRSQNSLARYLAEDGAVNRTKPVIFRRTFGRVSEIWHLDMGLGWIGDGFGLIEEEDYLLEQQNLEQMEGMGQWLVEEDQGSGV